MNVIVKYGRVDDGNKVYRPGETVPGLSKEEVQQLIEAGICQYGPSGEVVTSDELDGAKAAAAAIMTGDLGNTQDNAGADNDPVGLDIMSPDEFSALKPDGQKETLESIGIEPASKEAERVKQYNEWFKIQADDLNV
ncbi:hypothetical protein [Paenibacillus sp. FJAT-26967]|uniref:hypothetical protein n=1 Tax=Paenibacillus sp. FJAT-26967 TaxID=1729690 RepID=UPI0008383025|nr:hypothetical protein [Paenibacillus sp. FJAT-26967]